MCRKGKTVRAPLLRTAREIQCAKLGAGSAINVPSRALEYLRFVAEEPGIGTRKDGMDYASEPIEQSGPVVR